MDQFENNGYEVSAQEQTPAEQYIAPVQTTSVQDQFASFSFPKPERKAKKKTRRPTGKRFLSILLVLALVIGSCTVTAVSMNARWQNKLEEQAAQQQMALDALRKELKNNTGTDKTQQNPGSVASEGLLTPAQVFEMNVDAVVAISNQGITTNIFGQVSQTASSGSGFIISADGYVVTNYHVVKGANTLQVITSDGAEHNAQVAGYDASNDLAVLKIEGADLPYVSMGSSDELVVGDQVAAIGNPLGELTSTLTVGYISAKNRLVNTDGTAMNMMQTDAAINSGNSGGPLFNMKGEVVGITTAKYSGTSNSGATIEGIGFAIPMDDVRGMIDDIINVGYVKTGYLGVMVQDVPAEDAQKYGLPTGALIVEVLEDSCAQKAGLQAGDIVTAVGDNKVASLADLTKVLRLYEPGQEAELTFYRSGATMTVKVTFDEKPATTTEQTPSQQQTEPTTPSYDEYDGYEGFGGFGGFGDFGSLFPFFP